MEFCIPSRVEPGPVNKVRGYSQRTIYNFISTILIAQMRMNQTMRKHGRNGNCYDMPSLSSFQGFLDRKGIVKMEMSAKNIEK